MREHLLICFILVVAALDIESTATSKVPGSVRNEPTPHPNLKKLKFAEIPESGPPCDGEITGQPPVDTKNHVSQASHRPGKPGEEMTTEHPAGNVIGGSQNDAGNTIDAEFPQPDSNLKEHDSDVKDSPEEGLKDTGEYSSPDQKEATNPEEAADLSSQIDPTPSSDEASTAENPPTTMATPTAEEATPSDAKPSVATSTGDEEVTPSPLTTTTAPTENGDREESRKLPSDDKEVKDTELPEEDSQLIEVPPTTDSPVLAVDLSEHDMPAFADWKKEFYENDTKNNGGSNKVYEPENVEKKPVVLTKPISSAGEAVSDMRNYASSECGAKVLTSNKEAGKQISVLNENKDEYMMQPCSARKWFVIELCEPVLIRRIDMANLELFSSTFENFTVYISRAASAGGKERPGKDWHSIGTFHAKEERAIQAFNIDQLELFTSFVKIEILSHYGNEHYCPITIIRVYGMGVDDDDDPLTGSEETQDGEQEEAVLSTQAPPTVEADNPVDIDKLFCSQLSAPIFPPQPSECHRCYRTLTDVPHHCSPAVYHIQQSASEDNQSPVDSTYGSADDSSKETQKPCDPEDAPKPTPGADIQPTPSSDLVPEAGKPQGNNTDTSNSNGTKSAHKKVKPSPDLESAGSGFVLVTPSTDLPASSSVTSEYSQTTPSPSDTQSGEETQDPRDPEFVLPSPPTLAEPPTEAPPEQPIQEDSAVVTTSTTTPTPITQEESASSPSTTEEESHDLSDDTPYPANSRYPRQRNTAISKLSNQVKSLEHNLQVTNRYLEEMSNKYKNQKNDLQRALNHTVTSLHNTTKKLEALKKDYSSLKELTGSLTEEITELRDSLENMQSVGWTIPLVISTLVIAIIISSCRGSGTHHTPITRAEIERVLEDMPEGPLHRHKRSGSDAGTIGRGEDNSLYPAPAISRSKSHAAFDSALEGSTDIGAVSEDRTLLSLQNGHYTPPKALAKANMPSVDQCDAASPHKHKDCIEIISPATWRSFDTPDSKTAKSNKKKRKGQKSKSAKSIFSSQSAPGHMGQIDEREPPDP